jgi:hypothetical protein
MVRGEVGVPADHLDQRSSWAFERTEQPSSPGAEDICQTIPGVLIHCLYKSERVVSDVHQTNADIMHVLVPAHQL